MKPLMYCIIIAFTTLLLSHRPNKQLNEFPPAAAELKSFGKPDEVREFPKGKVELVNIGGAMVARATFEPGWKWSTSVQPLAKTKSCEAPHFQYHLAGRLMVKMDDGTVLECKPGDVSLLPNGHDAWVVGDEPAVVVDFQGMIDYAKKR
jgi:hypothetical protein